MLKNADTTKSNKYEGIVFSVKVVFITTDINLSENVKIMKITEVQTSILTSRSYLCLLHF